MDDTAEKGEKERETEREGVDGHAVQGGGDFCLASPLDSLFPPGKKHRYSLETLAGLIYNRSRVLDRTASRGYRCTIRPVLSLSTYFHFLFFFIYLSYFTDSLPRRIRIHRIRGFALSTILSGFFHRRDSEYNDSLTRDRSSDTFRPLPITFQRLLGPTSRNFRYKERCTT